MSYMWGLANGMLGIDRQRALLAEAAADRRGTEAGRQPQSIGGISFRMLMLLMAVVLTVLFALGQTVHDAEARRVRGLAPEAEAAITAEIVIVENSTSTTE